MGKVACGAEIAFSKFSCCNPVGFTRGAFSRLVTIQASTDVLCVGNEVACGSANVYAPMASYLTAVKCCLTTGLQIDQKQIVSGDDTFGIATCAAGEVVCGGRGSTVNQIIGQLYCCKATAATQST